MASVYLKNPICLKCEWADIKIIYKIEMDQHYCTCNRCTFSWWMKVRGS